MTSPPVVMTRHVISDPLVKDEVTVWHNGNVVLVDELDKSSARDTGWVPKSLLPEVLDWLDAEARADKSDDLVGENLGNSLLFMEDRPIIDGESISKIIGDSLRFDDRKQSIEFPASDGFRSGLETFNI